MASEGSKKDDVFGEAYRLQPPPSQSNATGSRQPRGRRVRQQSVNSQNDPEHSNKEYVSNLFNSLNPQNGTLSASTLVPLFRQSKLSNAALGEIWQIADKNNKGHLIESEFWLSLRLIALSQKGIKPTLAAAEDISLLPTFDNITASNEDAVPPPPLSGASLWSIPPQNKESYAALFYDLDPKDEYLDGIKARDSFLKTGLNVEKLAQIWSLADSQERGKLLLEEFLIAMHLIELVKGNMVANLPAKVPYELIKSATDATSDVITNESRESTAKPSINEEPWAITEQQVDKIKEVYMGFPRTSSGDVLAKDCVGYFMNSGLSKDSLAQVWELASYRDVDSLNLNEFSIAMLLIQNTLNGIPLPSSLPLSLKQYFLENGEDLATESHIKENLFELSSLDVNQIVVQPEFYPVVTFSDKADDYTPENKDQLSRQLLDLKATYESDQLLIKELETSTSLEKLALDDLVTKIRSLMSHNSHLKSEQSISKREADRLADEIEEMKTQCAAMEDEESRLNQLTEKLEKDNRIELSFLDYNIEAALKAHREINALLAQLGEPEIPTPNFLV